MGVETDPSELQSDQQAVDQFIALLTEVDGKLTRLLAIVEPALRNPRIKLFLGVK